MRKILTAITLAILLVMAGCYKDKGNYEYNVPEEPLVTNLDTVYKVLVGDSLIVSPTITFHNKNLLGYEWKIAVPELNSELYYKGPEIRTIFGLSASRYNARLTITDSSNEMKYFYSFIVEGNTDFSKGTTILSLEGGQSQLSFIKPDGSVKARLYEALQNGEKLAGNPQQVIAIRDQTNAPYDVTSYWILGSDSVNTGVQIDANTFKKKKYYKENFFDIPAVAQAGVFECSNSGTLMGVCNRKLYVGTNQTWNQSSTYGMFGLPAQGDYKLFEQAIFNQVSPYFLGYEKDRKQIVAFTNYGSAAYIGTGYQVDNTTAFDPVNVGLDMICFTQVNGSNCFAFAKAQDGTLYELKFGAAYTGAIKLTPEYKRIFAQPSLITIDTKWTVSPAEIFYFSSGDKIYRYNPLNQEIKPLTTDFGQRKVTMVKLTDNGNTLLAGVEGAYYKLDVSTGKFGDILKKIDGIPGAPVDAAIRE
jgi:hypothetical protein